MHFEQFDAQTQIIIAECMQKDLARQKIDKISKKLRQRLMLNNIHNEIQLISCMNKHLEIAFDSIKKIQLLSQLTREEVLQVLNGISFLKSFRKNNERQYLRLEYENAHKMLLVTGIQKQYVEEIITKFNNFNRRPVEHNSKVNAKIVHSNIHWVAIETSSEQAASMLKKCLRGEKRNMDLQPAKNSYKIQRRRIRIVIVKEDLLTLLIDAMTQNKAQMFQKNFILLPTQPLEKRKSQQLTNGFKDAIKTTIIYRPLLYNNIQNYSTKNEQKQQQFSDGFSESNSLNSEIIDASKMKDIIQTSEQGIQSQSNGLITNEQLQASSSQNNSPKQPYPIQNNHQQQKVETKDSKQKQIEGNLNFQVFKVNQPQKEESSQYIIQANQDLLCTEKHSPVYKKGQPYKNIFQVGDIKENYTQTDQDLYSVLSNAQMRRLMQQFKNRNHSQLIQLPQWMKSESENERNRHRFFSSLCKPKLIRQRKIQ